jgi:hypothetical protein
MQTQYERLADIDHSRSMQWEIIKEYLPIQRKQTYDLRDVVDVIF